MLLNPGAGELIGAIVVAVVIVGAIALMLFNSRCPKGGFHDWQFNRLGTMHIIQKCSKCPAERAVNPSESTD